MNAPNFSSILDQQATEIEAPKPLPVGAYLFIVKGLPRFDKSSKKGTDFVEFTVIPTEPYFDDNASDEEREELEEALTEAGGLGKFRERGMRLTFYITEDAKHRLKKFLCDCGIDPEGKSLAMMINDVPNQTFVGFVRHSASDDGEVIYANITKTARAE
jgi:hypothetical protein